jgi:hypothetical protein
MIIHNPILTGSFTVNGTDVSSITSSAASLTSLNDYTASQNNRNGTYATTGSNTFAGIQTVNSNLVVTGSITAQTLVVQTVTSSVVYSSGSNVFGNNIANTQVLTGSVTVTGSLAVVTTGTEFQVNSTGVNLGNVLTDSHVISGSLRVNPNGLFVSSSGNVGIGSTTPKEALEIVGLYGNIRIYGRAGISNNAITSNMYYDGTNWVRDNGSYGAAQVVLSAQLGAIIFGTTGSAVGDATERMRITSTGNVGIGTSSPSEQLSLMGANAYTSKIRFSYGASATGYYTNFGYNSDGNKAYLQMADGGSPLTVMTWNYNGNVGIGTSSPSYPLHVQGADGAFFSNSASSTYFRIRPAAANGSVNLQFGATGGAAPDLIFSNDPNAEKFRIKNDGNIEIASGNLTISAGSGTAYCSRIQTIYSFPYIETYLDSVASVSYQGRIHLRTNAANGAFVTGIRIENSGAVFLPQYGNGTMSISGGQITTSSDKNLKIDDGGIENALDKVLQLNPRYFHWKEESNLPTDIRQLGFYAQDVNEALGEEVANTPKDENDKWGIYDRGIIAMLTKAIQELKAEIDILKNK